MPDRERRRGRYRVEVFRARMLLEIGIATVTLVAACVVSLALKPDAETLRPIDGQSPGAEESPTCADDGAPAGDPGGRSPSASSSQ